MGAPPRSSRVFFVLPLAGALLGCTAETPRVSLRIHLAATTEREGYAPLSGPEGEALFIAPDPLVTEKDVREAVLLESARRRLLSIEFAPLPAHYLRTTTEEHIGDRLLILIDDEPLFAPLIQGPLQHGKIMLDAGFSRRRARELLVALNAPQTR